MEIKSEFEHKIEHDEIPEDLKYGENLSEREFMLLLSVMDSTISQTANLRDCGDGTLDHANDGLRLEDEHISEVRDGYALLTVFEDAVKYRQIENDLKEGSND